MRAKLLLLAVVSVSFVQVRGDPELEEAIKKGLERLQEVVQVGANDVASFKDFANKLTQDTYFRYIQTETAAKQGLEEAEKAVKNVVNSTKEKVDDSRLPESVEKCIEKFETQALVSMKGLFEELHKQGTNQFNLTVDNIESFKEAMAKRENYIRNEIKFTDNKIRGSKDVKSVDYAVSNFEAQVNKLRENIKWITGELEDTFNDYEKQINSYYSEFKLNLARIKSTASRNIRLCVLDTSDIINLFLDLIE